MFSFNDDVILDLRVKLSNEIFIKQKKTFKNFITFKTIHLKIIKQ